MTKTAFLRVYTADAESSGEPVPAFVRSFGMLSERETHPGWEAEWHGRRLVCPQNLRLCVLESTVAFANAFAGYGAGLIPEDAARAADRELREYQRAHPSQRSHVLTSAWHVPVRWFSPFDPSDKEVYEARGKPRLRYRTDLTDAKERVERVLEVLRSLAVFQGPAEELAQLLSWLEQFPDDSMLELDFGSVSEMFDSKDLVLDDSVELVRDSVDALDAGDMLRAGEKYGTVVSRWAHAFSVTFSS